MMMRKNGGSGVDLIFVVCCVGITRRSFVYGHGLERNYEEGVILTFKERRVYKSEFEKKNYFDTNASFGYRTLVVEFSCYGITSGVNTLKNTHTVDPSVASI